MTAPVADFASAVNAANVALPRHFGNALGDALETHGVAHLQWRWLSLAGNIAPEALDAALVDQHAAYLLPAQRDAHLAALVGAGLLEPRVDGFAVTAAGEIVASSLRHAILDTLAGAAPLPADDLAWLNAALIDVVDVAIELEPAFSTSGLHTALPPGLPHPDGPPATVLWGTVALLAAFREDCHQGAWRPHGVSGHAWEILTLMWHDYGDTLEEMLAFLAQRGANHAETQAAINALVAKRLLAEQPAEPGRYRLTMDGQQVRRAAEVKTDRLFGLVLADVDDETLRRATALLRRVAENPS